MPASVHQLPGLRARLMGAMAPLVNLVPLQRRSGTACLGDRLFSLAFGKSTSSGKTGRIHGIGRTASTSPVYSLRLPERRALRAAIAHAAVL